MYQFQSMAVHIWQNSVSFLTHLLFFLPCPHESPDFIVIRKRFLIKQLLGLQRDS